MFATHMPPLFRRLLPAAFALAAAAAQADVAQGPMVQAVTHSQAGVWVRTTIDQSVRVRYTGPSGVAKYTEPVTTSHASADDTASFLLMNLVAGSRYSYQVGTTDPATGIETWSGSYTFMTVRNIVDSMSIAVLSDFANKLVASAALQQAIDHRPDLLATIGDLDHRDPADKASGKPWPPEDWRHVLDSMRHMHRDTRDPATPLGRNFFSGIVGAPDTGRPQIPWVYAWDDHDFCANNQGLDCPFITQSRQAFHEYYILAPSNSTSAGCKSDADFESLTYGTLVQVFFLDARSQRNEADPTGKVAMLGACQHDWLVRNLHRSTALWKIVMSPTPLNATVKPWDAWSHFPAERAKFLADVADVRNLVVVSGDIHTGGAIDDGEHSGLPEVSTPHAGMPPTWVNTFCRDQEETLISRPGSWTIGSPLDPDVDVKPMNCLAKTFPDNYKVDRIVAPIYPLDGHFNPGYTWIDASPAALTITVHDTAGNVKQGQRADGSLVPLMLSLVPD